MFFQPSSGGRRYGPLAGEPWRKYGSTTVFPSGIVDGKAHYDVSPDAPIPATSERTIYNGWCLKKSEGDETAKVVIVNMAGSTDALEDRRVVRVNKNVLKTLIADKDLYAGEDPSSGAMDVDTPPAGELHAFKQTPLLQVKRDLGAKREMDVEEAP